MARRNRNRRIQISCVCFAALFGAAFYLAQHGKYGWTLFVMLPVLAGGLSTWSFQPETWKRAISVGAGAGACGCALFLMTGLEGIVCVLMALPIAVPLAILGSLLAYWGGGLSSPRQPAAMCLLLPVSMLFDSNAKPQFYPVTTTIVVNAAPERVWKNIVAFPPISAQPDWVLGTGFAYPIRTRIEGSGVGAPRRCDLSTGTVEERVTVWDEPRLLRFVVMSTPPAMREMGLYGPIYPRHVTGYYNSAEGQFALMALPGGRTLVVGTSWYRHGLWPAAYWRLWSDMVVHHIHRRVLEHIRALSEVHD
jgi:hypothetical protein